MTKNPNILFPTSRMWNCGDDFILFGIRNLVRETLPGFNAVAYNRNPELHHFRTIHRNLGLNVNSPSGPLQIDLATMLQDKTGLFDNSWRQSHGLTAIDYCIFAGTPEWFGPPLAPLVKQLAGTDIPVAYLGIGIFERSKPLAFSDLPADDARLLQRARLVTVRDQGCATLLAPVSTTQLPCPALFSAPDARHRNKKRKLALSTQGIRPENGQSINRETFDFSVALFRKLATRYDCTLVCHYVDELVELKPVLGDVMPFLYSYDASDYISIYEQFDLTVTTRIHGAGLCASLGIPSVVLAHSTRSETATGFLSELVNTNSMSVDDVAAKIDELQVDIRSSQIMEHKDAVRTRYIEALRNFFA